jgi:hypothetical protein
VLNVSRRGNIVDPQSWITVGKSSSGGGQNRTNRSPEWAKKSAILGHIYFFFTGQDPNLPDQASQTTGTGQGFRLDANRPNWRPDKHKPGLY